MSIISSGDHRSSHKVRKNQNCFASRSPGVVDTPMLDSDRGATDMFKQVIPMRRLGRPAELASAIAFLLSEDASYITGTELVVGGGFLI